MSKHKKQERKKEIDRKRQRRKKVLKAREKIERQKWENK